jgi:transposase
MVLEPLARAVMRELTVAAGRPMVHELRAMCDAVAYVARNGIEWRALPADFPPWDAVYAFYQRWNCRGLPAALVTRLRERLRARQGRAEQPSACVIDSQIVKCADTVPAATSGYHGGKKIKGRGRHLVTDSQGWLLALMVTAASASDRAVAQLLIPRLAAAFTGLQVMWGDSGYAGKNLAAWMLQTAGITLQVARRGRPHSFQVTPRRWVIERTFGWLMRYRRLARDYERRPDCHEAMICWATILIMTRRLARYDTGQRAPQRWGGDRQPKPDKNTQPEPAPLPTGSYMCTSGG